MKTYALKDFAVFFCYDESWPAGLAISCPNCGRKRMAWFRNPVGGGKPTRESPLWDRTGETLETISLTPDFFALGCYHSTITDGELQINSPFHCVAKRPVEAEAAA